MRPLSSLLSLLTLSLAGVTYAGSACIAFDVNWNLLAFGFNGKDYSAGTQDKWTSGAAQDITVTGRPPFNGPNASCYLSQFTNAIYVLGADISKPSSVYIYDATAKSWSTQAVNTQGFDPNSFSTILDHDTNIFYALSQGTIYALDMGLLKSANSTALSWNTVQDPGFGKDYQPVMALAQNHVHFLNVPGVAAGSAKIFVIHFSYLQPEPQSYGNFPAAHGQTTSFFKESGVQKEFAFIPDDGSATYVINVETNSTKTLAGPSIKDSLATYFASTDSLVQLSSSGKVSYIPYSNTSSAASAAGTWNTVSVLPVAASSNLGSGSGGSPTTTGKSASQTGGGSLNNNTNGAASHAPGSSWGVRGAIALFGLAVGLML